MSGFQRAALAPPPLSGLHLFPVLWFFSTERLVCVCGLADIFCSQTLHSVPCALLDAALAAICTGAGGFRERHLASPRLLRGHVLAEQRWPRPGVTWCEAGLFVGSSARSELSANEEPTIAPLWPAGPPLLSRRLSIRSLGLSEYFPINSSHFLFPCLPVPAVNYQGTIVSPIMQCCKKSHLVVVQMRGGG